MQVASATDSGHLPCLLPIERQSGIISSMRRRQSIFAVTTGLLLLIHLVLVLAVAPCSQGRCEGMAAVDDTRLLPICCCGPNCAAELAAPLGVETAPRVADAQLVSHAVTPRIPTAIPASTASMIDASTATGSGSARSPSLYLLHESFLI